MTLAHAVALMPSPRAHMGTVEAVVREHDALSDGRSLVRMAMWAQRFSPVVAVDPSDGLLLDVTGCARVFGGEQRLLARAIRQIERLGFAVTGAIAPTFGGAWALARFAERPAPIVDRDGLTEALAPLALESLRIERATVDHLTEIGIATVGELMAQARAALPARFGADVLLRLDQALGNAIETIAPLRAEPPVSAEILFDGPTTSTEAIEMAARQLLGQLTCVLREREAGARALVLELGRVDCVPVVIDAAFSRPCRDAGHLWSILRPRVERANLGYGVERVRITATRAGRLGHTQVERWRSERDSVGIGGSDAASERERAALIDQLSNRLGHDRVTRVELAATHNPERVAARRAAMEGAVGTDTSRVEVPPAARPSLLMERPEPVRAIALSPDHPPTRLVWRGREIAIDAGSGPERIGPEWWRGSATNAGPRWGSDRDYYRVRDTSGLWMWVYRESATARWFVHGVWA